MRTRLQKSSINYSDIRTRLKTKSKNVAFYTKPTSTTSSDKRAPCWGLLERLGKQIALEHTTNNCKLRCVIYAYAINNKNIQHSILFNVFNKRNQKTVQIKHINRTVFITALLFAHHRCFCIVSRIHLRVPHLVIPVVRTLL